MEDYKKAFTIAIKNCFPNDIIQYIYQNLSQSNQFDINSIWPEVFHHTVESIKILLQFGANINYRMPDTGSSPIMYSAQGGYINIVTVLLEHGADLTIKNNSDKDVYYYAKESNKVDLPILIKEFQDKKEKEELVKKNMLLEQQCQDMNNKLNYLLGAFEKMQMSVPDDMTHKKYKAIDD